MSNKQFLALPYGKDDFPLLREGNCYFVDKTPYLKTVFTDQCLKIRSLIYKVTVSFS